MDNFDDKKNSDMPPISQTTLHSKLRGSQTNSKLKLPNLLGENDDN